MNDHAFRLGVAATFTADPLAEPLRFWLAEAGLGGGPAFAPYGQVFPALLDPGDVFGGPGAVAVLVRAEDLIQGDGPAAVGAADSVDAADAADAADAVVADLVAALRTSARGTRVPHVLVVCPPSPGGGAHAAHARLTAGVAKRLADDPAVSVLDGAEPYEPGGVVAGRAGGGGPQRDGDGGHDEGDGVHDAFADRTGNIPYTERYFAALAGAIVRRAHAMRTPRPKVIVADCDGTLWDGVVGEDGPDGVEIGPARLEVWHELARQVEAGRLLCLSSKNDEDDVRAVFARHPELPIGLDRITATRIGWGAKSAALRSLADELNLGLDSFVFLDDSPVECAEVRAACPEALTLRLPADPAEAAAFLRNCWPLDVTTVTATDRDRTRLYQEERRRDRARSEMSLADFFATLDLRVTITPVGPEHEARAVQLAGRTNQFNLSGERSPGGERHVVAVGDRFGDYGVVGLTAVRQDGDTLRVDAFLLSCRALGRGVEHRMLAHLGALAAGRGLSRVALAFRESARNRPARDFLDGLPSVREDGEGVVWYVLDAGAAAAVAYVPGSRTAAAEPTATEPEPQPGTEPAVPAGEPQAGGPADWARIERIATRLTSAGAALDAMRHDRPRIGPVDGASPVEASVMRWWAELLDTPPASVDDGFFELGGHSLRLVQFMARVRAEYGVELPFDTLYTTSFTVAQVAKVIEERQLAQAGDEELAGLLDELAGLSEEEIDALLSAGDG
ncbi:HAD-IIIC family phosphatase [Microbispora sp. RL4-1S]|uniref:HAD-IIIC family phosphatase n=1 Tax=Microbispora oryzae TaxID=2806554 RepID=A0A940WKF8_9ACTN|nr:HAD-IIIC family phosphatase [Microbispora oryzae]MBP2703140.1 HAD-IIIC family phosphatase [Microbispora oryzae]